MLHRRTFLTSALAATAAASLPKTVFAASPPPFKLYDTHAHFYSNNVAKYPFRNELIPIARFWAMEHPITPEVCFKAWDESGVEMGCGVQYNTTYFTDNRYLLDVAAQYPKRVVPIVILAPTAASTPGDLARLAKENHIAGVRFAGPPNAAGEFIFLNDAAHASWEAANELGLVVVLMPYAGDQPAAMAKVATLAARYPNVKIVLDHLGFPEAVVTPTFGLSPQHLALKDHKNVYYKYTTYLIEILQKGGVPTKDFLNFAVGHYGADRFVWGSDIGNSGGDYKDFVKHALDSAAGLTLAQQKAVFYDTAKAIFVPGGRGPARP